MQVAKKNPSIRVGEFKKHTKGFGSKYMSKFGFKKGKRLGRNEQGTPQVIPFVKSKNKAALGAQRGLVNMTTPIRMTNDVIQEFNKDQCTSIISYILLCRLCFDKEPPW